MSLTLRQYQKDALDALNNHLRTKETNPCVVVATAGGKSFIMAEAIRLWKNAYPPFRVCVLAHRKELVDQNAKELKGIDPSADIGIYAAGLGEHETEHAITYASIDSVYNKAGCFLPFDALIIDEAHRVPLRGEGKYRRFISECQQFNPNLRVIGFTATPYRLSGGPICHRNYILNEVCYETKIDELIRDGFLCPLRSKVSDNTPDLSKVKKQGGDYQQKSLGAVVRDASLVRRAVEDALAHLNSESRRCCVWFCVDVDHCQAVLNELRYHGESAAAVTGETDNATRDRLVEAFRAGQFRHLLNVNVFTEGFNVKQVDAVVLLRPTLSRALFCLDDKTEVLTNNGWKKTVDAGDLVASFNTETGEISFCKPLASVRRKLEEDEFFCHIKSQSVDIRVTNNHTIIYKARKNGSIIKSTAERVASLKSGCSIPICGHGKFRGVSLSDDEIRFVAWFMTDGTLNRATNAIQITQSEHQKWCADIERCLDGCNFKYGKHLHSGGTQFNETSPRVIWTISKGNPRGTMKDRTGWGHLEKYISKEIPDSLFDMDERQFEIMLETMHMADGHKQRSDKFTQRSYHICKGNKRFAERLQIMAITRGWKANVSIHTYNKNPLYVVHLKKTEFANVGSHHDNRPKWIKEQHTDESCWCVQTKDGTIVTRRNGKVAILGNCQMVGRAMRLHPSKTDALVLDYGHNIETHGPIDAPYDEHVRVEVCAKCREVFARGIRKCPKCGWEIPKQVIEEREKAERERQMHEEHAAQLAILGSTPTEYPVSSVMVNRHEKCGVASLCVTYRCGIQTFREWVCLDHEGYAHTKAVCWWKERFGDDAHIPTVDEALEDMFLGYEIQKRTASVTVVKRGKYNEIIGHKLIKGESK